MTDAAGSMAMAALAARTVIERKDFTELVPRVGSRLNLQRGALPADESYWPGAVAGTAAALGWPPPRIRSAGLRLTLDATLPAGPTGGATPLPTCT